MKSIKTLALSLVVLTFGLAGCMSDGDGEEAARTTSMETNSGAVSTTSPATDLRVTLDKLLGEHAMLAQFATQKGLEGKPDFQAIAGALDQNSVALGDAIGSVYGDEARETFLDGKAM